MTRRDLLGMAAAGLGGCLLPAGRRADGREDRAASGKTVGPGRIFISASPGQNDGALCGVFAVEPETGEWRRVDAEAGPGARVSTDGKTLAFMKPGTRGMPEGEGIWTCEVEGDGEPRRVSDLSGRALWSPEGRTVIVSGSRGERDVFETWKMDRDGSNRTRLPIPEAEIVIDWSPDGRWLLTSSTRAADGTEKRIGRTVLARHLDGSDPHTISEGTLYVTHRVSPDSRTVVFPRQEDEGALLNSLWTVPIEGGEPRLILKRADDLSPFFVVWSPDGRRLAVDLLETKLGAEGKPTLEGRHIEIMDLDGTNRRRLDLPHESPVPIDWR